MTEKIDMTTCRVPPWNTVKHQNPATIATINHEEMTMARPTGTRNTKTELLNVIRSTRETVAGRGQAGKKPAVTEKGSYVTYNPLGLRQNHFFAIELVTPGTGPFPAALRRPVAASLWNLLRPPPVPSVQQAAESGRGNPESVTFLCR
jgi:hypothetical protein